MADPEIGTAPVLRDPANLVSPRARTLWFIGAIVRSLLLAALGVVLTLAEVLDLPLWVWISYAVLAIGYSVAMPVYRYRVHRWENTGTAVYTQSGWLSVERRIAPMSRVQTVDLEQTAVSRLFGIATVTVTTASAAGPLRIEGLAHEVAERLVEELTRRAEAETSDAT